jgi:DNA-binding CsgD family transcriptional regulator
MLYIVSNADSTISNEDVLALSAQRSDIETDILIPLHNRLAVAIQLLRQDLNRKPDYRWLYAILITLIIVGVGICAYTSRKRRQHKLLSQEVDDMRHEKESLQEIHNQIVQEHNDYTGTLITQIQQNCIILRQSEDFPNNICWKEFNTMSKIINDNFGMLVQKLQKIYHLQEKEIRLCILVLFDTFNSKQQAKLLFYSESGIRNFKNRVAKKLGTNSTELRDFLINLAINEHSKCTQ